MSAAYAIAATRRTIRRLVAALVGWRENARARHRLLRCQDIDPRFADDIGLATSGLETERRRPCWRKPARR